MSLFEKIKKLYALNHQDDFAYSEAEVTYFEALYGFKLPKLLKEYYLSLGNHVALNRNQIRFYRPRRLWVTEDNYLVFAEKQGTIVWAFNLSEREKEKPKVFRALEAEMDRALWQEENLLLDQFLYAGAMINGVNGALPFRAFGMNEFDDLTTETLSLIRSEWEEVTRNEPFQNSRIFTYQDEDAIVIEYDKENNPLSISIGTSNNARFQHLLSTLPINWTSISN